MDFGGVVNPGVSSEVPHLTVGPQVTIPPAIGVQLASEEVLSSRVPLPAMGPEIGFGVEKDEVQLALERALAQWDVKPPSGVLAIEGSRPGLHAAGLEPIPAQNKTPRGMADPTGQGQSASPADSRPLTGPTTEPLSPEAQAQESQEKRREGGRRKKSGQGCCGKSWKPEETPQQALQYT